MVLIKSCTSSNHPNSKCWFRGGFLLLASVLLVPPWTRCMAAVKNSFDPSISRGQGQARQGVEPRAEDVQSGVDESFISNINYNYCDLCQGLTILEDVNPFPNVTCSMMNEIFKDPSFQSSSFHPNSTGNLPGTCRADIGFNAAFESCCEASIPVYECEGNIQEYLFGDSSTYNSIVPPITSHKPDQKLNVSVFLQFDALDSVKVEEGTTTIYLSVMLTWNDPRLTWDINDFDKCSNIIDAWIGYDVETASIWMPNLEVLNRISGVEDFPSAKANVFADGTVRLYRYGEIKAFCSFTGIGNIPFDIVGCQIFFGDFNRFHSQPVSFYYENPGYVIFGQFQQEYNEWTVVPELGEQYINADGIVVYNVFFRRATQHYVQNVIIPTVLLTYLSFLTFCLDMRVGERLGFTMAIALVIIANQIVFTGLTPISSHGLWLDKFVSWSFYWILIGIVQSVVIGFLFFIREDRMNQSEEDKNIYSHYSEEDGNQEEIERLAVPEDAESNEKKNATDPFQKFLFTFSLRRFDMLVLFLSVVSYTIFFITMYSMGRTGKGWLRNDPDWFYENNVTNLDDVSYLNGDPEKR